MTTRLRVDWPACRAHGLCHELLPETVRLDEWGYPVVVHAISESELAAAQEAARTCPRRALRLVDDEADPVTSRGGVLPWTRRAR